MLPVSEMKHLNNGECADIYEVDAHTVLKLGKPGWSRDMLYQEYLNGKQINNSGIPSPAVYDFVELEGRYGYTMEKLTDVTVLNLMWQHPWKIKAYSKKLAAIHAQIHRAETPEELPALVDAYSGFIASKQSIPEQTKRRILQDLNRLSAERQSCICHSDFHAMNVLVDGAGYAVIDWVLASRGNPESDVAGTYLITRVYSQHIGRGNLFKRLAAALGGILCAEIYLKEYIAITNMDKKKVFAWIPIRAATYLDVGLPPHLERIFQTTVAKHYR